jgi:SAM-dependent methyltransferase
MTPCRVCESSQVVEVFKASSDHAFTSELKPITVRLRLGLCSRCGHCLALDSPPGGASAYYAETYDLLTSSAEADDLYDVRADGTPIYRQQIELENLKRLLTLPSKGQILDYGCGKGAFLSRFLKEYPAWTAFGFDVSEKYRPFVERVIPPSNYVIHSLESLVERQAKFDLVVMFQVLEHLEQPAHALRILRELLTENGILYVTVPHVLENSIDLFVADHLSHFTPSSLQLLLQRNGLVQAFTSDIHQAGQITAAFRRDRSPQSKPWDDLGPSYSAAMRERIGAELSLWKRFAESANTFIQKHDRTAIYGAGAVGTYILTSAYAQRDKLVGFLDRNPFKVGKPHHGIPVFSPERPPEGMDAIVAAISPFRARAVLSAAGLLDRKIPILFADSSL